MLVALTLLAMLTTSVLTLPICADIEPVASTMNTRSIFSDARTSFIKPWISVRRSVRWSSRLAVASLRFVSADSSSFASFRSSSIRFITASSSSLSPRVAVLVLSFAASDSCRFSRYSVVPVFALSSTFLRELRIFFMAMNASFSALLIAVPDLYAAATASLRLIRSAVLAVCSLSIVSFCLLAAESRTSDATLSSRVAVPAFIFSTIFAFFDSSVAVSSRDASSVCVTLTKVSLSSLVAVPSFSFLLRD
mmetsp:Transcript_5052/g.9850  ORF Transcript_5052/g.9850 Transcript_5052/m.9850 type:complete len:250 (-) Transcript_5052:112-861(-)